MQLLMMIYRKNNYHLINLLCSQYHQVEKELDAKDQSLYDMEESNKELTKELAQKEKDIAEVRTIRIFEGPLSITSGQDLRDHPS